MIVRISGFNFVSRIDCCMRSKYIKSKQNRNLDIWAIKWQHFLITVNYFLIFRDYGSSSRISLQPFKTISNYGTLEIIHARAYFRLQRCKFSFLHFHIYICIYIIFISSYTCCDISIVLLFIQTSTLTLKGQHNKT